jgi:hypothetical protein
MREKEREAFMVYVYAKKSTPAPPFSFLDHFLPLLRIFFLTLSLPHTCTTIFLSLITMLTPAAQGLNNSSKVL